MPKGHGHANGFNFVIKNFGHLLAITRQPPCASKVFSVGMVNKKCWMYPRGGLSEARLLYGNYFHTLMAPNILDP